MATRTRNSQVKPTIVEDVKAKPQQAKPQQQATSREQLEAKSGKSEIIALVVGALFSGALAYYGSIASAFLSVAALMLTGSVFLAFMIYFVGLVITIYYSALVGARVQRMMLDGSLDAKITEARHAVSSTASRWYGSVASKLSFA